MDDKKTLRDEFAMTALEIGVSLRYVIRDGEKVLQEFIGWKKELGEMKAVFQWQDIPTVDEETGEEIKG